MPVTFTKHARKRMEERGISMSQVFRVLAFGRSSETRLNAVWTVDARRVPDQSWIGLLSDIAVVCTKDFRVITVYKTNLSLAG